MSRAGQMLRWAIDTFGAIALDRSERMERFAEEALELAHALGLTRTEVDRIADRIWSRMPTDSHTEIAQTMLCLELLGEVMGVSVSKLADREFDRIRTIPKSEWRRRHDAKVRQGFARWAPGDEPPENP